MEGVAGRGVRELLDAMGKGDREAAAEFVLKHGPKIRRRIRGKMRAMRRLFDSTDIISTLGRRLDGYVHRGNFEARSEAELWSLVFRIADHSVEEKARIVRSDGVKEEGLASEPGRRYETGAGERNRTESEPAALLSLLPLEEDRVIARLWAAGYPSDVIGSEVGLSAESVRKRWRQIKLRLRSAGEESPR